MSDLISRQAAIDELSQRYIIMDNPHYIGYNAGLDEAQKVIKALEAYVPVINVGDMISRRAATTIPVMPKEHRHYQTNNLDDAYEQGWTDLQECIEKLPPVQPTLMRSIGKLVGYTGNKCPNCGRLRVERYESGLEICEKCNWCEQTKSYWLDWEEG